MESGIRPQPLEKSQKINKCRAMFISDSRVQKCSTGQRFICTEVTSYKIHTLEVNYIVHQIRNLNFQTSKLKFPMLYLAWQLLEGLCNLTLCLLLISKFIYVLLWHPRPIQIGSFLKEDKKIGDTKLNLVQQESFSSRLESFWSALQLKQTHFSLRNWAQQIQSITSNQ